MLRFWLLPGRVGNAALSLTALRQGLSSPFSTFTFVLPHWSSSITAEYKHHMGEARRKHILPASDEVPAQQKHYLCQTERQPVQGELISVLGTGTMFWTPLTTIHSLVPASLQLKLEPQCFAQRY